MKASKIVFYISMAVSLAIIALFFFVGFGNTDIYNGNELRSPMFTDALLYWIYVLTILAVVLVELTLTNPLRVGAFAPSLFQEKKR